VLADLRLRAAALPALLLVTTCGGEQENPLRLSQMNFFVSSTGSRTGNLGGIAGADKRCQTLAEKVGQGKRRWKAYLSADKHPDDPSKPLHARDRMENGGPWYNATGMKIADTVEELHTKVNGNFTVFVTEHGAAVPGWWLGSLPPCEHDILTGTKHDGTAHVGHTCKDWTSDSEDDDSAIGHTDGIGPNFWNGPFIPSWNFAHRSRGCHSTRPMGGNGRIYCFTVDK
jgi:hypothetical protein